MNPPANPPPDEPPERDFVADYRKRERDEQQGREWHRASGTGLEFVGSILLFGLLGWGVDRLARTTPWGMVAGLLLGFAVGLFLLIRMGLRSFKK